MRLCRWIKQKGSDWEHLQFLLFCGDKKLILDLPDAAGVIVSDKESDVIKFATEDLRKAPQVTQPPAEVVPQPELPLQSNPQQTWLTLNETPEVQRVALAKSIKLPCNWCSPQSL